MKPRIIIEWRSRTTHYVHTFDTSFGCEHTYCGESIAHDLRYVAPEGTQVLCMGCIAAEPT